MNNNNSILKNEKFVACGGKLICELIGGSRLYGLETPESDIDYRGIFVSQDDLYRSGLETIESIVQSGEIDSTYYTMLRFIKLLRKSNTQTLEILHAPEDSFTEATDVFNNMRYFKNRLIDTEILKESLKGYVFSEMRLATGERSGQLGGKRKKTLETYGFSYKNFVQILRLCAVGKTFFKEGEYMICVKEFDSELHNQLMDIKTNPGNYTIEGLVKMVNESFEDMKNQFEKSKFKLTFDADLAASFIIMA